MKIKLPVKWKRGPVRSLILGAPELLKAAKKVDRYWGGNPDPEFAELRAAIAKAEGRL